MPLWFRLCTLVQPDVAQLNSLNSNTSPSGFTSSARAMSHTRLISHASRGHIHALTNTCYQRTITHRHALKAQTYRRTLVGVLDWPWPDKRAMKINASSLSDRLGNWRAEGLVNQEPDRCHSGPLNNRSSHHPHTHIYQHTHTHTDSH